MPRNSLLVACALLPLGACQIGAPYDPVRNMAYDQQRLAEVLGTRMAGPPERCVMSTPGMDMRVIGNTIVARSGGRIYINQPTGDCSEADRGGAALVMEPEPGGLHCANEPIRVVSSGVTIGSCQLNQWIPFR